MPANLNFQDKAFPIPNDIDYVWVAQHTALKQTDSQCLLFCLAISYPYGFTSYFCSFYT